MIDSAVRRFNYIFRQKKKSGRRGGHNIPMRKLQSAIISLVMLFFVCHGCASRHGDTQSGQKSCGKFGQCAEALINKDLDRGIRAFNERDYPKALAEIEKARAKAYSLCPESGGLAWVIFWHGRILFSMGQYEEAENDYATAITLAEKTLGPGDPQLIEMLWAEGDLFFSESRYKEAEAVCLKGLAQAEQYLGPNDLQVAYCLDVLGRVFSKTGRGEEARQAFNRALTIKDGMDPLEARVYFTLMDLGNVYFREGDLAKAEEYYLQSLEIFPDYFKALHNMGTINFYYAVKAREAGDKAGAKNYLQLSIGYFRKAIQANPNPESCNDLGSSLIMAADLTDFPWMKSDILDEAIMNYDRAISMQPNFVKPYINKGIALNRLEQKQEAIQMFQLAVEISGGTDPSAYCLLCQTLGEDGQNEKAAACFDECLKHFPGNQTCMEGKANQVGEMNTDH